MYKFAYGFRKVARCKKRLRVTEFALWCMLSMSKFSYQKTASLQGEAAKRKVCSFVYAIYELRKVLIMPRSSSLVLPFVYL